MSIRARVPERRAPAAAHPARGAQQRQRHAGLPPAAAVRRRAARANSAPSHAVAVIRLMLPCQTQPPTPTTRSTARWWWSPSGLYTGHHPRLAERFVPQEEQGPVGALGRCRPLDAAAAQVYGPQRLVGAAGRAQLDCHAQAVGRLAHQQLPPGRRRARTRFLASTTRPTPSPVRFSLSQALRDLSQSLVWPCAGEAFSQIVAANSATHTARLLQEDDVSLAVRICAQGAHQGTQGSHHASDLWLCVAVPGLYGRKFVREAHSQVQCSSADSALLPLTIRL